MVLSSAFRHTEARTGAPEETAAWGAALAARLRPGDVVALQGDLGAGKTRLVRGLCAALGVPPERVTSPTFTIVNEYAGTGGPIYHIDAYRVASLDEFHELGYEEYLYGRGLCLVEWPERIAVLLPPHTLVVRLEHLGADRRRIILFEPPERTLSGDEPQ